MTTKHELDWKAGRLHHTPDHTRYWYAWNGVGRYVTLHGNEWELSEFRASDKSERVIGIFDSWAEAVLAS